MSGTEGQATSRYETEGGQSLGVLGTFLPRIPRFVGRKAIGEIEFLGSTSSCGTPMSKHICANELESYHDSEFLDESAVRG